MGLDLLVLQRGVIRSGGSGMLGNGALVVLTSGVVQPQSLGSPFCFILFFFFVIAQQNVN